MAELPKEALLDISMASERLLQLAKRLADIADSADAQAVAPKIQMEVEEALGIVQKISESISVAW